MYKKILAPLDGSKFSECNLEHIKSISMGCNTSEIILLLVTDSVHTAEEFINELGNNWLSDAEKLAQTKIKKYLNKVADSLKHEGSNVKTVVIQGNPADKILEYSIDHKIDLIIMSTHGRSGASRWAFGSVTDKVLHHSTVPVLIITPPGCRINT